MSFLKRLFSPTPENRDFEVLIYEKDYKEMCAWVLKRENIETGGDLFGLWADKRTAAIQLVLGPGKDCRRTTASFYQDVPYLERVGSYLTQHEGLCHIGEWHSHHRLGLARPSGGDERTVWSNMPSYKLNRFVIFIANIEPWKKSESVNIGCFLFEIDTENGQQLPVVQGKFKIMAGENPHALKPEVLSQVSLDAEQRYTVDELKTFKIQTSDDCRGKLTTVEYRRQDDKVQDSKNGTKKHGERAATNSSSEGEGNVRKRKKQSEDQDMTNQLSHIDLRDDGLDNTALKKPKTSGGKSNRLAEDALQGTGANPQDNCHDEGQATPEHTNRQHPKTKEARRLQRKEQKESQKKGSAVKEGVSEVEQPDLESGLKSKEALNALSQDSSKTASQEKDKMGAQEELKRQSQEVCPAENNVHGESLKAQQEEQDTESAK